MNYWLHITAVPDGEAPLWVRECWVGLKIPLAQTTKSAQLHVSCGVLTGPKNPSLAAKWWKENTPHIIRPNNHFFFSKEVGFIND